MSDIAPLVITNTEIYQRELETITHNLANANTTGFKSLGNSFVSTLESTLAAAGESEEPTTAELTLIQQTDFAQGKLVHTGRSLDLALSGSGFFTIETPDGLRYTRNGVFHMDANGQLVSASGHTVSGVAGPITLPPSVDLKQIEVTPDGSIKTGLQTVGRIQLSTFPDSEQALTPMGNGEFRAPEGLAPLPPSPRGDLTVHQGYQEASNVNTVQALVDMISVARLYEANMSFLSAKSEASKAIMQVAMG
jgi:flagellar basal body rod protein FlgG